jgi:hypothetical protein
MVFKDGGFHKSGLLTRKQADDDYVPRVEKDSFPTWLVVPLLESGASEMIRACARLSPVSSSGDTKIAPSPALGGTQVARTPPAEDQLAPRLRERHCPILRSFRGHRPLSSLMWEMLTI